VVGGSGVILHLTAIRLALSFPLGRNRGHCLRDSRNFLPNNMRTYLAGGFAVVLSFYAICSIGAVANVGVASAVSNNLLVARWPRTFRGRGRLELCWFIGFHLAPAMTERKGCLARIPETICPRNNRFADRTAHSRASVNHARWGMGMSDEMPLLPAESSRFVHEGGCSECVRACIGRNRAGC
jgi:hypothetical protein